MKIKKYLLAILSIVFFASYSFLLFTIGSSLHTSDNEKANATNETKVSRQDDISLIIKETNGEIYVYKENSSTPEKKLDIDYYSLREYDKQKFKSGIKISSLEELTLLEEDFSN